MQHPHPFSFGGGGCAVTTGGFHFGVNPTWAAAGISCSLGMGLYPVLELGLDVGLFGDARRWSVFSACPCESDCSSVFSGVFSTFSVPSALLGS